MASYLKAILGSSNVEIRGSIMKNSGVKAERGLIGEGRGLKFKLEWVEHLPILGYLNEINCVVKSR
jgi:hypothetical protein